MSLREIEKMLDKLGEQLFKIEDMYLVYSELGLHYNKAVDPKSSEMYLKLINLHKGFFIPAQQALRAALTVELYTYILSKDFLSLQQAITHLKNAENGIDLLEDYVRIKARNKNILKHLGKYRNGYYAHKTNATLSKFPNSSDKEFQDLFEDIKTLLNKAAGHFNKAHWYMEGDSRESIKDTHDMMNNLLRGETQRLNEIDVDYVSKLYQSGRDKWMKS